MTEAMRFFIFQIYSRYALIGAVAALFFGSCKKQDKYPIPNVPVNITINLDLPSYQPLNAPGGYVYVSGGSRGIVVYRNFDEFVALDRHSTYDSDNPQAIVMVNPDNVFELIDTLSGSRFSITSGTVIEGPAKFGLKKYNTYWDGYYTVNIYN